MGKKNLSIFPLLRLSTVTTQSIYHELHAIADSQDRNSHFKDIPMDSWSSFIEYCRRPSGKDYCVWSKGFDIRERSLITLDFTEDSALSHSTGNEKIILTSEVNNQNLFHRSSFLKTSVPSSLISSITARAL